MVIEEQMGKVIELKRIGDGSMVVQISEKLTTSSEITAHFQLCFADVHMCIIVIYYDCAGGCLFLCMFFKLLCLFESGWWLLCLLVSPQRKLFGFNNKN